MNIYKNPEVKRLIRKFTSVKNNALNQEFLCMLPNCNNIAINSHIIQRSQFLEPIASNQKLRALQTKEIYPGKLPKFQRIPIKDIMTFKGFCAIHDQMVFAEIEKQPFNLNNTNHLALFVYRGICHELNKKQIIINWTKELLNETSDFDEDLNKQFTTNLDLYNLGMNDISFYKDQIERDIYRSETNFEYQVHHLEKREVVASVFVTIQNLIGLDSAILTDEEWRNNPLLAVAITIFPKDDDLILILGYLKKDIEEIEKFIMNLGGISLNFVNQILIEYAETWACSESFYEKNVKHQLETVQKACIGINVNVRAGIFEIPNIMEY